MGRPSCSNGMDVLIKKIKHRQHQALLLSTCVSWDDVKGSQMVGYWEGLLLALTQHRDL